MKIRIVLIFVIQSFFLPMSYAVTSDKGRYELPKLPSQQEYVGIMVRFHKWPSKAEKKVIKKILIKHGLSKGRMITKSSKLVSYKWKKLKFRKDVLAACEDISKITIVKRCSPNAVLYPQS